jgi:hypothetical protein
VALLAPRFEAHFIVPEEATSQQGPKTVRFLKEQDVRGCDVLDEGTAMQEEGKRMEEERITGVAPLSQPERLRYDVTSTPHKHLNLSS